MYAYGNAASGVRFVITILFFSLVGNCSVLAAELWGLRDGLKLAKDLNYSNIVVCTDAIAIINVIRNQNQNQSSASEQIDIWLQVSTLEGFKMAQLKHDYQEANRCADVLARNAMTQELGFIIFDVVRLW